MCVDESIQIRKAKGRDLKSIIKFVDYWLRNGAKSQGVPGGSNDYFIPRNRLKDYLRKYTTYLALKDGDIIGWLVVNKNETLLHLLIAGNYRNSGIGTTMLHISRPEWIRSKTDQSTGNPKRFYQKCGYKRVHRSLLGTNHNIQMFKRDAASIPP